MHYYSSNTVLKEKQLSGVIYKITRSVIIHRIKTNNNNKMV